MIYSNVEDILEVSFSDSIGWWQLSNNEGLEIFVHDSADYTKCKMEFYLENKNFPGKFNAKDIFPTFLSSEYRKQWDVLLQEIKVIDSIDECNDICYFSFAEGNHDLCILRSWRTPELGYADNQYIISSRSINHPSVPEITGIDRSCILPSGFILSDVADGRIKVTYLMQMSGPILKFTLQNVPTVTLTRIKNLISWFSKLEHSYAEQK